MLSLVRLTCLLLLGVYSLQLWGQVEETEEGSQWMVHPCDVPGKGNLDSVRQLIEYPQSLLSAGVEGTTIMKVRIDSSGRVRSYEVMTSPHPLLARAVSEKVGLARLEMEPCFLAYWKRLGDRNSLYIPFDTPAPASLD